MDGAVVDVFGVLTRELMVLTVGQEHPQDCRCGVCLEYWRMLGPSGDPEAPYGPFTVGEVAPQLVN